MGHSQVASKSQTSKEVEDFLLNDITQQRIFNALREITPLSSIVLDEVKESIVSSLVISVLEYRCVGDNGVSIYMTLIVDAKEEEKIERFSITNVAGPIRGSNCLLYALSGELTSRDEEEHTQERKSS